MVQKSTDRSTIDSYLEYVKNKEKNNSTNSKIYAYKSKKFSNNYIKLRKEQYINKNYLIKC